MYKHSMGKASQKLQLWFNATTVLQKKSISQKKTRAYKTNFDDDFNGRHSGTLRRQHTQLFSEMCTFSDRHNS